MEFQTSTKTCIHQIWAIYYLAFLLLLCMFIHLNKTAEKESTFLTNFARILWYKLHLRNAAVLACHDAGMVAANGGPTNALGFFCLFLVWSFSAHLAIVILQSSMHFYIKIFSWFWNTVFLCSLWWSRNQWRFEWLRTAQEAIWLTDKAKNRVSFCAMS